MTLASVSRAVSVIDFTIGENVDILRKRAGLTKSDLAARFGLSPSAMSVKLSGQRGWSALDIQDAARLFGVRMAVITGEEALPEPTATAAVSDIDRQRVRRPRPVNDVKQLDSGDVTNMFEWAATRAERAS